MFAELVINVEAPLEGTFHYHIPRDLERTLRIGHLVEVEFGRRLAQGVLIAFDDTAPVEDTKPIIALIDPEPVLFWWQIELAQWMSHQTVALWGGLWGLGRFGFCQILLQVFRSTNVIAIDENLWHRWPSGNCTQGGFGVITIQHQLFELNTGIMQ